MRTPCWRKAARRRQPLLLEKDRAPVRSDMELAIGRAYEAAGENEKAASAFRNVYFNLPTSFEAEAAGTELRKLGISGSVAERRTRADLLFKAKHYADAAHDYRELVERGEPRGPPAGAIGPGGSARKKRQAVATPARFWPPWERKPATPKPNASTC